MSLLRGRFEGEASADMRAFASSLDVDLDMVGEDIAGSIAHATMLGECEILTLAESDAIVRALQDIRDSHRAGSWRPDESQEDVHMAVEARLIELLGDTGKKLHTARSRNDQVATDVRLWLGRRLTELDQALVLLIASLLDRVERDGRALMPGYTHLQRGQPILLGHHLLAHAWALARDRERLAGARTRVDRSPLGACAMAGTSHPIDRDRTAALLGFSAVLDNAMDAVSARDHEQEVASVCAIAMGHLSRMAEELVLWSSSEWRFVRLGDVHATGSSIMPQKRNPDAAELVRGKSARVLGDAVTLFALTRSLPLAYNRDLQEDRRPLFDAVLTTTQCTRISAAMWRDLTVYADRFEQELRGDPALATELADFLVTQGVPFREAHDIIGRYVRECEKQAKGLGDLDPALRASLHPALGGDLSATLDPRAAAMRRTSRGGTAWPECERQVALLRATLPLREHA